MKINFYCYKMGFLGRREDRNTTSQLKHDNNYALTEPNQRKIGNAINNLSKYSDEENLKFLLDVADNLKYRTNIDTGKKVKNDWKGMLQTATATSLANSNPILREKYQPEFDKVFNSKKALNDDEKEILVAKKEIMAAADLNSLKENSNPNIKALERNIDYFVASSEIPIKQKSYVMKRLAYFMSPEYKINPQLKDKKTQVLAEMMNDLTVNTAESENFPNIKAINQKQMGICAAISIVRKTVAYEDKPNYVDSIMSELDDSDKVMVYDRFNLGSGKRIPVKKNYIDFNYALEKGYRIVDASASQWMNIADMYGINNENLEEYNSYDKLNFDAFHDSHFVKNFEDDKLMRKQSYYQALTKAEETIKGYKSQLIIADVNRVENHNQFFKNIEASANSKKVITRGLAKLMPDKDFKALNSIASEMISLEKHYSEDIKKGKPELAEFSFIPNEETSQKIKKVKNYLISKGVSDEKALNDVADSIVTSIEEINSLASKINPSSTATSKITDAKRAYHAEATHRAAIIIGLQEKDVLTDNLISFHIPDRETRISNGLGNLIKIAEKTDNQLLMNHLAKIFNKTPDDRKGIVECLQAVKYNLNANTTEVLDFLYDRMGLESRKNILLNEVKESIEAVQKADKEEQKRIASCLEIKNDKQTVLTQLKKFENELSKEEVPEKTYNEILNKIGYKDQAEMFVERFKTVVQYLQNKDDPDWEYNVKAIKECNNMPESATMEDILEVFKDIGAQYNGLATEIDMAERILNSCSEPGLLPIDTKEGKSILCNGPALVIDAMERRGELIPSKTMKKLQTRFNAIEKIKSADEFASRQGKISQPELNRLTKEESDAVKHIKKNINKTYSDIVKARTNQYREIRPLLEELNREVGSSEGSYWIANEGNSGLNGAQQVKIIEQITGRPYYMERNIDTAVDRIMNGTHSGVSSSSVFHDKIGGHAQYIADIKEEGPNKKLVLYHDNTWGPSEHENVWIDSDGVTRTDYSDRRGGETGYITNDSWRNGNYVEDLLTKPGEVIPENVNSKVYNRINHTDNESFKFAIMYDAIIPGESPKLKDIAGSIKDTIYIPDKVWIKDFEKEASQMSAKELKAAGLAMDYAVESYRKKLEELDRRLDKSMLSEGINSRADWEKLPENDFVKLTFEKVATKLANPNFYMYDKLASAKSMDEIQKIKDTLRENAINDFGYSFDKDKDIALYYAYEHSREVSHKLIELLSANNVPYDAELVPKILKNTAHFAKENNEKFDGSLKHTIDFIVNKSMKQYREFVPSTPDSEKVAKEFEPFLRDKLNEIFYFNENDLKSDKFRAKAVRNWIDRTFEPKNDKEFVEIYRKLQDMTTEEFEQYTKNLKDEDLGIKDIDGYDVLVKYKAQNQQAQSDIANIIFNQEYLGQIKSSKTKPSYKYQKTQKSLRGAYYSGGKTFDDIYREFSNSMVSLEYEKLFNKYKDVNFRKYNAFPAYPKVDLISDRSLEEKLESIDRTTSETLSVIKLRKKVLNSYNLVTKLESYFGKMSDDKKLSEKEYQAVNSLAGEFLTNNYDDPQMGEGLQAALKIMEFDKNEPVKSYRPLIKTIKLEYSMAEKTNKEHPFMETNKESLAYLKKYFDTLVSFNIPQQYQRLIREDLKNWINEEFRMQDPTLSGKYGSMEIRAALDKFSKGNKKKQLEDFAELESVLNEVHIIKNEDVLNDNKISAFSKTQEAKKLASQYLDKYVKPEARLQAEKMMNDYLKNRLETATARRYDENRANIAKTKFFEDFKKYHISKHPQELLKAYMMSCAKDAKHPEDRKIYSQMLEHNLEMAKLIDIQEGLMKAVSSGNAAAVKKHFKDYYVNPYEEDYQMTMDSPESISFIVKNLLVNYNTETAKMFVEKLGLAETFIDISAKEFKMFDVDQKIKSVVKIATATSKNMTAASEVLKDLQSKINNSDEPEKLIDEAKEALIQKTKGNGRKKEIKNYLEALDDSKKQIQEDPTVKRSMIVEINMDEVKAENVQKSNQESVNTQNFLNLVNTMYTFIANLNLPEYSEAYKKQQELTKEFDEFLVKYKNALKKLAEVCQGIKLMGDFNDEGVVVEDN